MSSPKELIVARRVHSEETDTARIFDLPPELLLRILSFLEPASTVLLSLTSKGALHFVRKAGLWKPCISSLHAALQTIDKSAPCQRRRFVQLLADDNPHLLACQRCKKLHQSLSDEFQRAQSDPIPISISDRRQHDTSSQALVTFGPLWPQYAFTFDEARSAVDRSSIGELGIFTLPELSISTDWTLVRLGASCSNPGFIHGYVKLDNEAVNAYGSLFLHRVQRILLLPEKVKPFLKADTRHHPVDEVFGVCRHEMNIQSSFSPYLDCQDLDHIDRLGVYNTISSLASTAQKKLHLEEPAGLGGLDNDEAQLYHNLFAGCPQCPTDYVVTIHNHFRTGVEIVVDVYQALGFLSVTNRNWDYCWTGRMEHRYKNIVSRRRDFPSTPPYMFPTALGKSARKDPSAPSVEDVRELHGHERRAMSKWSRRL